MHIDITVSAGTYEGGLDLSEGSELQTALREAIAKFLGTDQTPDGGTQPASDLEELLFSKADPQYPYGYINIVTQQYAAGEASDGSASMEGDVTVDGFELLIAGLYFANEERIKAENAQRLTYEGTELDDNVVIETENVTEVIVRTGGGDDRVDLRVKQVPAASIGVNNVDAATMLDIINAIRDITGGVVADGVAGEIRARAGACRGHPRAGADHRQRHPEPAHHDRDRPHRRRRGPGGGMPGERDRPLYRRHRRHRPAHRQAVCAVQF